MKKYTYKDWLDGKLILKYDFIIPKGENPILVEWNDFNCEDDILRIKRKQKEIFDERVTNLLGKYKSVFNKEIEASKEPKEHCRMTLNQIDTIFTGVLTPTEFIRTEYWNCVFFYNDLSEIQKNYKNSIIRGVEVDYAFINSPTMNYQRQGENYQIYTHSLYLFRKWVETFQPQQTEVKTEQEIIEASRTKDIILKELYGIDKNKGWEYAFVNEKDLNDFADLLTRYFEYQPYDLPKKIIELKKDCRTRFAKSLRPIHKELSNENKKLKSDIEFFEIIKVLNHFKKMSYEELYQAITR
jgi:hypothetical protein